MIVIPMAGLSRRFAEAGHALPKYMLDLHGRSVFAHAVGSFSQYFGRERFLFIARDIADTRGFLRRAIAELGIAHADVAMLDAPTAGQADTVRLGLDDAGVGDDEPLTIFNIDTFRPGFRYPAAAWMGRADGYLEVMNGDDPGFSFVLPLDEDQRVARTAEKEVISRLASTGLYWFRRAASFRAALATAQPHVNGELYIAPLYNRLIADGLDVRYQEVPAAEVVPCGTPAQYRALLDDGGNQRR